VKELASVRNGTLDHNYYGIKHHYELDIQIQTTARALDQGGRPGVDRGGGMAGFVDELRGQGVLAMRGLVGRLRRG